MELYFETLSENMEGYEDFVKEAWGFKVCTHSVGALEYYLITCLPLSTTDSTWRKLMETHGPNIVKTSDIARLMELFQVGSIFNVACFLSFCFS